MKSLAVVLGAAVVATGLSIATPPPALAGPPVMCLPCAPPDTTAGAGDGEFEVYRRGHSDHVDGRGDASQGYAPGKSTWIDVEEDVMPTCMGNEWGGGDALCGMAVNTCPTGQIRFWVRHRTIRYTRQADGTITSEMVVGWHDEPRTYCLGADDPGVPKIAQVIDRMQTEFASLPLAPSNVTSDPGPTTIVNIDTAFYAGASEPQRFDPVLLGTPVHVTATPKRWIWTWGDGKTDVTTTPGVPKHPVVSHKYTRVEDVIVSVVVEWTGTFTVGSDPTVFTIAAPTRTRAQTTPVRVREARSELVSR